GLPLTPPLEHYRAVLECRFSTDGRGIYTTRLGARRTWQLPRESREPELLLDMTELLASNRVTGRGEYMPLGGAGQAQPGDRLGRTQPELWPASADEVRDWSRRRVGECEDSKQWFGAIWHLDRLIAHDPAWQDRLRRGDAHAELGHWKPALADYT